MERHGEDEIGAGAMLAEPLTQDQGTNESPPVAKKAYPDQSKFSSLISPHGDDLMDINTPSQEPIFTNEHQHLHDEHGDDIARKNRKHEAQSFIKADSSSSFGGAGKTWKVTLGLRSQRKGPGKHAARTSTPFPSQLSRAVRRNQSVSLTVT